TPFPNSFKCFTCDKAVDNYNCNRWAEDRWCPAVFAVLQVCKKTEASRALLSECVSCCEGMICNVGIPTNATNAVFAVLQAHRTAGGSRALPSLALLVTTVTAVTAVTTVTTVTVALS
ncbi:PREDICTED: ly6/PLAUR domain-containing protein 6B-like, partial [Sturnus vulgaris]|uniref:ly6/PLAUR domain-containing protein 6B-like n=1 Tax=Sturnus vulgaris TaxID=9172 RepID=UPI00071AA4A0